MSKIISTCQEKYFTTHDNTEIFYRYWPAKTQAMDKKAIVIFHRGHEHSGRVAHLVEELKLDDCNIFAWDARGHGRTSGQRGYSPSLATSIKDVDSFIKHISLTYDIPIKNIIVIAQSVGAVLVSTWAHDYAPRIRGIILASPAFKVKLYVPCARLGLKILHKLRGNFFVNSYVKAKYLTHDPERIDSYNHDPLITRPISVNILLDLYETSERIVADAQAITIPTQLLISGSDWVVEKKPQDNFFDNLGSATKERHILPGFYHDTLGEKNRDIAIDKARDFITKLFNDQPQITSLQDAHLRGYTFEERNSIEKPLYPFSLKGILYSLIKISLSTLGRLSDGISMGLEKGFDSGSTLDYVYRNTAKGRFLMGRLFDRMYLNSIGWRGIRVRKDHLEKQITQATNALRTLNKPIHIVDIAAGFGRYVLEAIEKLPQQPTSILLRDYSDINVRDGKMLIKEKGLNTIVDFEKGDAFNAAELAQLNPKPTIAIVSGLYELFSDNTLLNQSLSGLAQSMESGSYLVYTNQPWHPQLEMIARTLTSHRGNTPWIMRRRTQNEMDQLVEAAGFRKIDQLIDEWGIFTVSLAIRE